MFFFSIPGDFLLPGLVCTGIMQKAAQAAFSLIDWGPGLRRVLRV